MLDFVAPECTEGTNALTYKWGLYDLKVRASRLTDDGKAELWFYHSNGGPVDKLLHTSQVNLMAHTTMGGLAKRMSEHSAEVPWLDIMTYITAHTVEYVRQGEPYQEIGNSAVVEKPAYIVYPLVVANQANIIFGERNSTKSTMALILSVLMSLPWANNELELTAPATPQRVLLLDWEVDRPTVEWQLQCIQNGIGIPKDDRVTFGYRRCYRPLKDDLDNIMGEIDKAAADILIIDSLGLACGGDINTAEAALNFYAALRQTKKTSLILAHTAKNTEKKTVFGSAFFENLARNIWEVTKVGEPESSNVKVMLTNTKSPPFARLHKSLGYNLDFDEQDNATRIETCDIKSVEQFLERMTAPIRIVEYLKTNGHKTPKEIEEALNMRAGTVRSALKRLCDHGDLHRLGETYAVSGNG